MGGIFSNGYSHPIKTPDLEDLHEDDSYEPISDLFVDDVGVKHRAALDDELDLGLNDDDLEQEMLIREDGARDAKEAAQSPDGAADWDLSLVDEDDIGAGKGLDEAELAEIDPVGRKR